MLYKIEKTEISDLAAEAEERYHTNAEFHAKAYRAAYAATPAIDNPKAQQLWFQIALSSAKLALIMAELDNTKEGG